MFWFIMGAVSTYDSGDQWGGVPRRRGWKRHKAVAGVSWRFDSKKGRGTLYDSDNKLLSYERV